MGWAGGSVATGSPSHSEENELTLFERINSKANRYLLIEL